MEPSQRVKTRAAVLKLILLGMLLFENAYTVIPASTKEEFEISGVVGKYMLTMHP